MSSHWKMLLLNKIFPNIVGKDAMRKYFLNVNVMYSSNANNFFIDLNHPGISEQDSLSVSHTGLTANAGTNKNTLVQVDKNVFIKTIIDKMLSKEPKTKYIESNNIVIDFSSPNIAKPFHVGHLRSTIIGNFIGNINEYYSNNVQRINYLGDWGTQFGLLQYGLKCKNINVEKMQSNPMKTLFDAYVTANKLAQTDEHVQVEARKYFADIEQGKTDLGDWRIIRDITVKDIEKIYKRLGVTFDNYQWESDYNGKAIKDLMQHLEDNNIIWKDESGKKVATINNRNVTVLKSDDSSLYLSRDIAALIDRYDKYKFNEMLYVVDNSQRDHFDALIQIVSKFNKDCAERCKHIKFGRIRGMSTRSGNVIFLNDILDEAKEKMHEQQLLSKNTRSAAFDDATCDILGITAVIINDLKQRRQKDYTFSWEKMLQSEGDSGIKLQYLHCRLWSLEQNCGVDLPNKCKPEYLVEPIIVELIAEIAKFDDVLFRSKQEYEACILVGYLFRLARHVNRVFNELKVKDVDEDLAQQRLLVFHVSRVVVKTGLEILGVKPLNEM